MVANSVLNHIPDPGPELGDPRINSRTVPKKEIAKKSEEKSKQDSHLSPQPMPQLTIPTCK